MKPIRILHVVGRMHRAGLETFIMNVYRNIDRDKVQFDFLTHYTEQGDYDREIEQLGGRIYKLSVMEDKNIFLYFKQLNDFFKAHKEYKVIHGHWTTFGIFYMYFAKRNGIMHRIAHSHSSYSAGGIRGSTINFLSKLMKNMSNHYFACSESALNWLYGKNSKIVRSGKAKIIKNAIDIESFSFNSEMRNAYRKKMGIENKFVLGHIGRFNYPKNHEFILELFRDIYSREKKSVLLLIGSGPEKQNIYEKVSELGLNDVVFFLGTRSDIPELLSTMDVFIFPSKYEALGIVAIEAQAASLPIVVSNSIPRDVHLTKLISSISLEAPKENWIEKILEMRDLKRVNTYEDIRRGGYDIKSESKYLEEYYLRLFLL